MLLNHNKKIFHLYPVLLFVICFVFFNFAYMTFAITVPESVLDGEYFTPVCGPGAVYFDVPGIYSPKNCGESINFSNLEGINYEVRDLDENGNYMPPSAYVYAMFENVGCTDPVAENYDPAAIYDDGFCTYQTVSGCTDPTANNYNPVAVNDDGSCSYGSSVPISAPSRVDNGASFTPVCGAGIVYFDSPGAFAPMNCGDSVTFGHTNATYEVRGLDVNGAVVLPTINVISRYVSSGIYIDPLSNKIRSYTPEVTILFPKIGSIFSTDMLVDYSVTDKNDSGSETEKNTKGLNVNPVSIFYSDKISEWYNQIIELSNKTLIKADLPAIGTYKWSVKDLVPGTFYRIIVDAIDRAGLTGEMVSDLFTVDFTTPLFNVSTDPTLVKKGDVKILVEASENLQKLPIVKVTQRGGKTIIVKMNGKDSTYEGTYTVSEGYDGTAKIEVEGTDLAGNVGKELISGGTFSIGVNPPPKPIISSDINKTVTYQATTTLSGTVREDTEVIFSLNGTSTITIKPDAKGNFTVKNIVLDKLKNNGVNYLSIVSRDILGNTSESSNIEIKYNIAPKISIVGPTVGQILSNQTSITTKTTDENFDSLIFTYQIISSSDFNSNNLNNNWNTISKDVPSGSLTYDTTEVDDGDYFIRASVTDGYATATSSPVRITIKNTLPYFRFENGRKTVTKNSEVTITGKALISPSMVNTTSIKNISYSLDGGDEWIDVKFDNDIPITEQKFSVSFSNLDEGIHTIMWRVQDNKNTIGRGSHVIIVDTTAPKVPITKTPKNNALITNDSDENLRKDGIQISIKGTAEAGSIVSLIFNNQTYTTKALPLGDYSFTGITIDKRGKQSLQFFATDESGNKSETKILSLIYNNPPIINIINPKPFRGLSGKAVISWNVTDFDSDEIKNVIVSYRNIGGTFKTLVSNGKANGTYTWDTTTLPEYNNYELKISASDSLSTSSAIVSFIIDRSPPTLLTFNLKKEMIDKKVNFSGDGTVSDGVSGIEFVEYSIKGIDEAERSPWYKGIITKGYLQKKASFYIKYPKDLADSSYTVFVRAVDIAGNISNEISKNINIDRTSPRIGSFFIIKNDLKLIPDQDGNISFYKNSKFSFSVSIEKDTKTAQLIIDYYKVELNRNITSGLWEATSSISTEYPLDILVTAEDDSGNISSNKKIGLFKSVNEGNVTSEEQPISSARIRVYKFNDITGHYDKINPSINGVASVIETDDNGNYELVLSAGKYRLSVVKSGYKVIKEEIILDRVEIVNRYFVTKKISGIERLISDIVNNWFY